MFRATVLIVTICFCFRVLHVYLFAIALMWNCLQCEPGTENVADTVEPKSKPCLKILSNFHDDFQTVQTCLFLKFLVLGRLPNWNFTPCAPPTRFLNGLALMLGCCSVCGCLMDMLISYPICVICYVWSIASLEPR